MIEHREANRWTSAALIPFLLSIAACGGDGSNGDVSGMS